MTDGWVRFPAKARLAATGILLLAVTAGVILRTVPFLEPLVSARPSFCALKVVTGIPCLACRGTRATLSLARGDLPAALRFNPLATLFVTAGFAAALAVAGTGRLPRPPVLPGHWKIAGWIMLATVLLGNWGYVIAQGG